MKPNGAVDLAYVRLGSSEPDASVGFLSDILGLQAVAGRGGDRAFRSDDRYHTVAIERDGTPALGIEMADLESLDAAAAALRAQGVDVREASAEECERRFVPRALVTRDATGNRIDLVVRPARSGRRFYGPRDAGIRGLQAVGLRSTDVDGDIAFWKAAAGATISDRVGEIAYLRFDAIHHRVALYPSDRAGVLYVTFAVENLDCIMQNFYFMQERQIRIVHGPGREAASGQTFVRFTDPSGQVFAFGCDMATIDPQRHRPRQFSHDLTSLCAWGSECTDVPELRVPGAA